MNKTISQVRAVDGVSIRIKRGEILGLVGESGCGKTTLARTIIRLTKPTGGKIFFDGNDITELRERDLRPLRREMQMVFQDPYASLDPRQKIRSAILEPVRIHKVTSSSREANDLAEQLIEKVGLNPDHLARYPHEFSGGQRQRIALAIALAVKPKFLVLDEPTSSLDVSVQAQMLNLLRDLQRDFKLTYLFVSHNMAVISQMCSRIAVMYRGRIVELAPTNVLFQHPKHPYTKTLLHSVPVPDPTKRKNHAQEPEEGKMRIKSLDEEELLKDTEVLQGCRFHDRCQFAADKCTVKEPRFLEIENDHWIECHYDIDFESSTQRNLPAAEA